VILIATNARDLTADFVVLALERRQVPFVRINTESLPSGRIMFDPCLGERGWTIELGKRSIRFFDVLAGYWRRPEPPGPLPEVSVASQAYCAEEWSAVLTSALRSIGHRWLNPPLSISQAENKPKQLAIAVALGLDVPETLVTNDFTKAREFVLAGPSVAKTLSSSLVVQGVEERAIFTTRIHKGDINNSGSISAAPIILQRDK
jgi:hypothetical protein